MQWKHQFEFAGFYAAKEKGFYKDVGLDVDFIEFQQNMDITKEVLDGNADYGLTYSTLIADYMQNKPIVFVANFFKQSPLVLVTQQDIVTPGDLKGKKIMGLLDSTHKQIILEMLDKFNISPKDFENIPRQFSVKSFIDKKVDALSVFTTNEVFLLEKKGVKYNILDPAAFGTKFYDLNLFTTRSELEKNPKRIDKFKNASIKGWEYALEHKDEIINLIKKKYNTQNKSKEALLFEAKQIEYLTLSHIYPMGSIDLERVQNIADSFAQSLGLKKISKESLKSFIFEVNDIKNELNSTQKNYLKNKKRIKMCVDPNWMPLDKIEGGRHIGVAFDFIKLISQNLNIPIELVETKTWLESLNNMKNKTCDILALAEKTPLRKEYLNFTSSYINTPLVIATKVGIPFMSDLNTIKDKPLGVVKNYSKYELLKNRYPNINLVEVESIHEGLEFVDQEKIFGFLDNAMVLNYEIQKESMQDIINITGQFPESFNLGIASRNDEPTLNEILEKSLLKIDMNTRDRIINKWINVNYQVKTDYKVVLQLGFFAFVLISAFIYWNLQLKAEITNREHIQKQLKQSEEKFRTLFDIAPIFLNAFDKDGKIVLWNKECENIFGWSFEEIEGLKDPIKQFYPDVDQYNKVLSSLNNKNIKSFQEWTPQTKEGKSLVTMWANVKLPNDEVINIGYDITNQRSNELSLQKNTEELEKAKKELEELNKTLEIRVEKEIEKNIKQQIILMQQSKLAQMGEMIENIAHQWRQPLAQINSSVLIIDTVLSQQKIVNEDIEEKLLEIESLTAYMSKTIDDFKNFFHPNKEKTTFSIKTVLDKSFNILKGSIHKHQIKFEIDIGKKVECYSYVAELQQVVLALLNNAIDALVSGNIKEPAIFISGFNDKADIIITIEDNGLGVKDQILDKIFDPYFTTKHKTQGTGLGLYISKMIIENGLNGTLNVINTTKGACFKITIPQGKV